MQTRMMSKLRFRATRSLFSITQFVTGSGFQIGFGFTTKHVVPVRDVRLTYVFICFPMYFLI